MRRGRHRLLASLVGLIVVLPPTDARGQAEDPIDLSSWFAESYPAVAGFGAGVWTVAGDGSSVIQSVNGQPTLFVSDFDARGSAFQGGIEVLSGGDDDIIGFALGYDPGDFENPDAEYLLIDWKASTQGFNFGAPSCTDGSTANRGIAISRVFGIPTADEFWGHVNYDAECSDLDNGVEELQRAATLGDTGWSTGTRYIFRFDFLPTEVRVYVDDVLELEIEGDFENGRFAFYNFSQGNVEYTAFTRAVPVEDVSWGQVKSRFAR